MAMHEGVAQALMELLRALTKLANNANLAVERELHPMQGLIDRASETKTQQERRR